MDKCKFCGEQLEENAKLCAACGKDQEEMEQTEAVEVAAEEAAQDAAPETEAASEEVSGETPEEDKEQPAGKATPKKIVLSVVAIVLLVAMIGGMLMMGMKPAATTPAGQESASVPATEFQGTIPADGNPEDVTAKGSYTVSDEAAAASAGTVVATMGEYTLTNAQLQVFYWNYIMSYLNSEDGYNALVYGLIDYGNPLDMQTCAADPSMTWQQYFLAAALENWKFMQALAIEAENAGYEITPENLAALESTPTTLEDTAVQMGYANAQELLVAQFGAGVTMEDYLHFEKLYYSSIPYYYEESAKITATAEEVEAFFLEHEEEYAQMGLLRSDILMDVRHILIMPDGATNQNVTTETFSEEAWAISEKKAEEILAMYHENPTEEHFAELANTYTQDGNDSNMDGVPDGGLYTGITRATNFVPEFLNWCIDENRVAGDTDIVRTDYGYHVMYCVKTEALWPQYVEQDILVEKSSQLILGAVERNVAVIDYGSIALAAVLMA